MIYPHAFICNHASFVLIIKVGMPVGQHCMWQQLLHSSADLGGRLRFSAARKHSHYLLLAAPAARSCNAPFTAIGLMCLYQQRVSGRQTLAHEVRMQTAHLGRIKRRRAYCTQPAFVFLEPGAHVPGKALRRSRSGQI